MERDIPEAGGIAWDDSPPPPKEPAVPIMRAVAGSVLRFVLLADGWVGVHVHSIDLRDTPCEGKDCPYQQYGTHRATRLKYYFAGWEQTVSRRVLVEVTEEAMREYWRDTVAHPPVARGNVIEVYRVGKARNAPGRFRICASKFGPNELPESFDVKGALVRNWRGDRTVRELPPQ